MSNYDEYSGTSLRRYVEVTVEALRDLDGGFDSIVVRGVSGLIVGAPVALLVGKPIVVVRKEGVQSHTSTLVSNFGEIGHSYVVVDDFVCVGGTLRAIKDAVAEMCTGDRWYSKPNRVSPTYRGLYQYTDESWYSGSSNHYEPSKVIRPPVGNHNQQFSVPTPVVYDFISKVADSSWSASATW